MLVGRDGRGTGLGLGAFRLRLLVRAVSPVDPLVDAGLKLLGLAGFLAAAGFGAGG
jgi:hypothetical protein